MTLTFIIIVFLLKCKETIEQLGCEDSYYYLTCSNNGGCDSCISNYFLHSNHCYECNKNCKTSNDNCKCDTCEDGNYLKNYQCLQCNSNCKTCINYASCCLSCNVGYYLTFINACKKCPEFCTECSSENICTSCKDNCFLFNNQCYECNKDCKTTSDNCKCDTCEDGYYLKNYQCLHCDSNCKTCIDLATKCLSCEEDSYIDSNQSCAKCCSPCRKCSNAETCITCVDNFFILQNFCYQCNKNCKTTNDNCKCETCNDVGYYLKNYQCLQCDSYSKTCKDSSSFCLSCNNGYYLTSSNLCEKCPDTCNECTDENTCTSCKDNHFLLIDKCYQCNKDCKTTSDNCKCETCNDGYYLNNYQCLQCNSICNSCLDSDRCTSCKDNFFIFNFKCYQCNKDCKLLIDNCRCITCEEGYFLKNYQCLKCKPNCKTCINKDNYCTSCNNTKLLYNNSCIDYDDNSYNNLNYLKIEKENEIKYYDEILYFIESLFTSDFFKTKDLDDGDDIFIQTEKINIYLTTIEIQKKRKDENITTIDSGKCEILLRDYYNISDDELLYMKILEVYQERMKIKKIEYNIYSKLNGTNLIKLDLSICQLSKIFISYPIEITENFDIFNTSSGYYNDICYSATSESGIDISLKDRKNIFIEKNKAVCQDYCVFSDYNHTNKKANCSCKARESHISFADMKINKDKLFENLININNIANLNILICYKKLFNINGILFNIGSYIIAAIILFHIISFFIFYLKQYGLIKNKIKFIICNIKSP